MAEKVWPKGTPVIATLGKSRIEGVLCDDSDWSQSLLFITVDGATSYISLRKDEWSFEFPVAVPTGKHAVVEYGIDSGLRRVNADYWVDFTGNRFDDSRVATMLADGGRVVFAGEESE